MPADTKTGPLASSSTWPANQAYALSAVFLLLGVAIGYFFLGSKLFPAPKVTVAPPASANLPVHGPGMGPHPVPTMDQMKQMAAVQTSALVEKLKTDPDNPKLLVQIAGIYKSSHQFKEASDYFGKALKIDPKNVPTRTEMASCLYYAGDVDGALGQLNQALKYNPDDVNALFNLGLIKWKGKNDAPGAIAAWQELLRKNPKLDRKPIVEKMIAEANAGTKPAN